jgi:predicted DNA-binding transcriptional regulator YafY
MEYLATIQKAIANRLVLEIEYTNLQKELSRRLAEPIGLVFYAFNWHLIGWCHLKKDYRDFRVSRIIRLRCTEESFINKRHLPMDEYMKQIPVDF